MKWDGYEYTVVDTFTPDFNVLSNWKAERIIPGESSCVDSWNRHKR